ncbi:ATP-binding cassette domain-containing protein [bacterium]|nr:ATP-binding cassette domain-containing protein [bacterium]
MVGENGAGKSTIMKILYGMFEPDHGVISLKGKPTPIRTPQEAISLGIGMVHQHFMLVPTLTVWENIILGKEPSLWFVDEASVMGQLENLKKEFGFQVELNQKVETLSVGHQQQVELLKLLFRKSDILILDEPTAVLSPQEVESLFERLKNLKKAGKTIILITHKLKEILNHTDCVTIMRQGTVVETLATRDLSEEILAEKMIGHKRSPLKRHEEAHTPQAKLQVSSLTLKKPMGQKLSDISFEVNAGEIVGIAGIEGNGQQELIKCLAGIERHFDGQIVFNNQNILDVDSYDLKQMGFSIIPPDRHREAVILPFPFQKTLSWGITKREKFEMAGSYRDLRQNPS